MIFSVRAVVEDLAVLLGGEEPRAKRV